MKKILFFTLLVVLLFGCASARQKRTINIGEVTNDIEVEIVGSYTQQNDPGRAADLGGTVPIQGVPVDLKALIESQGAAQTVSMDIKKIGGSFRLKIVGTGVQNGRSIEAKTGNDHVLIGELESQFGE
jgi:hypothetical protein